MTKHLGTFQSPFKKKFKKNYNTEHRHDARINNEDNVVSLLKPTANTLWLFVEDVKIKS